MLILMQRWPRVLRFCITFLHGRGKTFQMQLFIVLQVTRISWASRSVLEMQGSRWACRCCLPMMDTASHVMLVLPVHRAYPCFSSVALHAGCAPQCCHPSCKFILARAPQRMIYCKYPAFQRAPASNVLPCYGRATPCVEFLAGVAMIMRRTLPGMSLAPAEPSRWLATSFLACSAALWLCEMMSRWTGNRVWRFPLDR